MKSKYNKLRYILCGILYLVASATNLMANDHTTMGKDFWFSFGRLAHYDEPGYRYPQDYPMDRYDPQIRVSAIRKTQVTITFTELGSSIIVNLEAGEARTILLNDAQKRAAYSVASGTTSKSIHLVASERVSVYAINQGYGNADATNILPTPSLGTDYYHMSYKPLGSNEGNFSDGYTIVALEANTVLKNGKTGATIATLQRGQVYSYYTSTSTLLDLTGTYVTASKPVAYFVTNSGTFIPEDQGMLDGLFQQMMPVSSWGNVFLVPATVQKKERVRVIASEGSTNLTIEGGSYRVIKGTLTNMAAGSFTEIEITSGCFISSNKAIGVCSYLTGCRYVGGMSSAYGDPAVAWIPSLQQKIDSIAISPIIPEHTLLQHHYALIITSTASKTETKIKNGNGVFVPLTGVTWVDVNSAAGYSFSYCSKLLYDADNSSNGTLNYGFTNPDGLVVLGYGLGNTGKTSGESYYYLAGAATRSINPSFYVNGIHNDDVNGHVFCGPEVSVQSVISSRSLTDFSVRWYLNGSEIYAGQNLEKWDRTLPAGINKIRMEVKNYQNKIDVREAEFIINEVSIINPGSNVMTVGDTKQLTGIGYPAYLQGLWSSSNASVATVDQTGKVTAVAPGSTMIAYVYNGCYTTLPLTVEEKVIVNLWIGQGKGDPGFVSTQANKNLWSVPANWTANRLPTSAEIVEYHPEAIDLWVDGDYVAAGVKNLTNANLIVLANRKLRLTSSYEIGNASTARVIVKAFVPDYPTQTGVNGTFITPIGLEALIASPVPRTISIPVKVEFYSKAKTATGVTNSGLMNWQYFGVPVRNVIANEALTGAAVRRYDEKLFNYWVTVAKTEALLPFKGYEISWWETPQCNGLFNFIGELENRNNNMVLTRTAANVLFSGQHVVANPYTAGLSIATGLGFGNALEKTVYLFHTGSSANWDGWIDGGAKTNLTGSGQYLAIPQNLAGSRMLSSMQGFVVKIQDGLTGTNSERTLGFRYNGVGDNAETRSSTTNEDELMYTTVGLSSKGVAKDCMWMFTNPQATRGFDNGYDGRKITGASRLSQLYAQEEDGNYQVNSVDDIDGTWLAFKAEEGIKDYTLTFYHANADQKYEAIYLIDTMNDNRKVDITSNGSEYHFTGNNNVAAEKRFQIMAVTRGTVGNQLTEAERFKVYLDDETLILDNGEDKNAKIIVYNVSGVVIHTAHIKANETIRINNFKQIAAGVCLVQANYSDHNIVKKIIVKK